MNGHTTHRVALITGANKGMGRDGCRATRRAGHDGCDRCQRPAARRGDRRSSALSGDDAHAATLDVYRPFAARVAAKQVEERFGHLDVLINNAGITGSGQVAPQDAHDQVPTSVDMDMVRAVFETNVLGVIRVTNAMLPLLRRSPVPRIVNVSSQPRR